MASDTTDDITLQDDFIFDTGTADLVQVFINLHQISSAGSLPKLVLESCNDPSRGEWQEEWDSTGRAQASLDPEFTSLTPAVRSQMAVRAFRFSPSAFQFEAQYLIDMLAVFGPTALSPGSLSQLTQTRIQGRINTILNNRFVVGPNWVLAPPASVIFEVW